MGRRNGALKNALAAVAELPRQLQRELAVRLVTQTADADTTVVYLQRLSSSKQRRLSQLMDKSNEGHLSQAEYAELKQLGVDVERMLMENSRAVARALRPELFDERGRTVRNRFHRALRDVPGRHVQPRRVTARA